MVERGGAGFGRVLGHQHAGACRNARCIHEPCCAAMMRARRHVDTVGPTGTTNRREWVRALGPSLGSGR